MIDHKIAKVIVRTPMWRDFDYLIPDSLKEFPDLVGLRVLVPFGKRQVVGVISRVSADSQIDPDKLKPITDALDDAPLLNSVLIRLCEWASDYYHYPLGEVLFGGLPKKLRQVRQVVPTKMTAESREITSKPLELSNAQKSAITKIEAVPAFASILLHGVTGSGKTEVYLQSIANCLAKKKQALVLVPEISLTPQTVLRFKSRFDVPIVMMHSGLKDSERLSSWFAAQSGEAAILIGTRSAIFTPMPHLGIIIIDEEHDASFKQQSGFRYSARDLAVMRAYIEKVPIVLGSATPSLETLYNVWHTKRYEYAALPERVGASKSPQVKIVDIKKERLVAGLSPYLLAEMQRHLDADGQVLLFLNRRGYAPVFMCHHCGFSERCPRCDTYLTYHYECRQLRCHHCDYQKSAPIVCAECHQSDLMPVGMGTERLEHELNERFKETAVIRIDRDTTRKKGTLQTLLQSAHDEKASILVGTQMLAKGHHFENLTLVAVVDADNGFFSTDFRALERLAQLLVQVAGRAGREETPGEVLIQTHHPDHPMLQTLLHSGYTEFAKQVLLERKEALLPPYAHMALFRCEHANESSSLSFLKAIRERMEKHISDDVYVLGPIPAPMPRRAGKFRAQLLVQSKNRSDLQKSLNDIMSDTWVKRQKRQIQWSLDVDPVEMI